MISLLTYPLREYNWRNQPQRDENCNLSYAHVDRLCGLVVRVPGYRSRGPGSIPDATPKKIVDLERGPLSLVSTTAELLDRKVAAPF
jgi:hypothetical protein